MNEQSSHGKADGKNLGAVPSQGITVHGNGKSSQPVGQSRFLFSHVQVVVGRLSRGAIHGTIAVYPTSTEAPRWTGPWSITFAVITVGGVIATIAVLTLVLHIAVSFAEGVLLVGEVLGSNLTLFRTASFLPMLRAVRAAPTVATRVPVVVPITVAAVILAGGVVTATTGRRGPPTTGRAARGPVTIVAVTPRVEPPRGRRRGARPLQKVRNVLENCC